MKQIDIFYADDDDDDLMFFNEAVDRISDEAVNEIRLHVHKNGETLIENIKKSKSKNGVVFLDINMPLKSGFQLLEEIRKEPEIRHFPVIMYSTGSNQDYIEKSITLEADFYVIKPYEFGKLVQMITDFAKMNWENQKRDTENFLYK